MDFFKNILGVSPPVDYKALMAQGAQVIDVRSPGEYQSGHMPGSVNIPVDQLPKKLAQLKKDKPVITVCASGMRSGSAQGLLSRQGYEAYNGGPWGSFMRKVS